MSERDELNKLRRLKELKDKGARYIEPARAVVSGLARQVVGGLTGIGAEVLPGGRTGAEQVEMVQSGAYQPQSEPGKKGLKTLGDLAQFGIDMVNFPLSGLAGLAELFSGQGLDQSVETVGSVQKQGAGTTAGRRVFEETGSPLAATIAETAPALAESVLGTGTATQVVRGAARGTRAAVDVAQRGTEVVRSTMQDLFQYQTPTRQRIAELLEQGSTDRITAGFRLEDPKPLPPGTQTLLPAPAGAGPRQLPPPAAGSAPYQSTIPQAHQQGTRRAVNDPIQREAIRQGFDNGVVATVRGASPADRNKMRVMTDIMERGKNNSIYAASNRPGDVVGDTLLTRVNHVLKTNNDAGKKLDEVAESLRGQEVDAFPVVANFIDDLEAIGIKVGDDFELDFKGSDIEDLAGPQNAITRAVKRLPKDSPIDAYEIHRLKKFIDETVTFGKSGEGLAGKTERLLKNLRHDLDTLLDNSFTDYNAVNTTYADTINALDTLQDAAGRKLNFTGKNADKASGQILRGLLSNNRSRVNLLDAVSEVEKVARKYGGVYEDDILTQVLFADELDAVFGPVARTSFQGQIRQAIPKSKTEIINRVIDSTIENLRGVNPEAAFAAIKELLK